MVQGRGALAAGSPACASRLPRMLPLSCPTLALPRHRNKLAAWLEAHEGPRGADAVLEATITVLTTAKVGLRVLGPWFRVWGPWSRSLDAALAEQLAPGSKPRHWRSLDAPGSAGRLIPDTERADGANGGGESNGIIDGGKGGAIGTFAGWFRHVTTGRVETEINLQLGRYTVKRSFPHTQHVMIAGVETQVILQLEHSQINALLIKNSKP
eukprot:365194-Chlamydomonas_euryale.AAC.3